MVIFVEHHLYFRKKFLTDKLWIFRLGYLANIVLRINDEKLSLQRKNKWHDVLLVLEFKH